MPKGKKSKAKPRQMVPWEDRFTQLEGYTEDHGHANVPKRYKDIEGLGDWVNTQRKAYKDKKLSADRIECLEEIGFQWVVRAAELFVSWDERFKQLEEYKRVNKHTNVPNKYKDNPQLGYWVHKQRRRKKNNKLSGDRIERLNDIGFQWELRRGRSSAVCIISDDEEEVDEYEDEGLVEGATLGKADSDKFDSDDEIEIVNTYNRNERMKKRAVQESSSTSTVCQGKEKRRKVNDDQGISAVDEISPSISALATTDQDELEKMRKEHSMEMEAMKKSHDQAMSTLKESHNNQTSALRDDLEEERTKGNLLRSAYNATKEMMDIRNGQNVTLLQAHTTYKVAANETIRYSKEEKEKEISQLRNMYEKELDETKRKHRAEVSTLQDKLKEVSSKVPSPKKSSDRVKKGEANSLNSLSARPCESSSPTLQREMRNAGGRGLDRASLCWQHDIAGSSMCISLFDDLGLQLPSQVDNAYEEDLQSSFFVKTEPEPDEIFASV